MAMLLGYERIVNDKRILISVEDSDSLWVTLKIKGHDDIRFKASNSVDDIEIVSIPELHNEIRIIIDAVHQSYIRCTRDSFNRYIC